MRNIFSNNGDDCINYNNYNDIIYNYDYIEEELGKLILPRLKQFKKDIKFITYLYEGFRENNSSIIVIYNEKYIQRELLDEEKDFIRELIELKKNSDFYIEAFSSLQILMKEILKENYEQKHLIYDIIETLPKYVILNEDLINLFKKHNNSENKIFTVNSLVSIFEFFEKLCWEQIKKTVSADYQLELSEDIKNYLIDYFSDDKNDNEKIIKLKDFSAALRKIISRFLAGSSQKADIPSEYNLKVYINKADIWNKKIIENNKFQDEIDQIFKFDILVAHCYNLYNLFEKEDIIYEEIYERKNNKQNVIENNEFEINTNSNQNDINNNINNINDNNQEDKKEKEIENENLEEEEENEEDEEREYE